MGRNDLSPQWLPNLIAELLSSLDAGARPVVVVLDGLDEAVGWNVTHQLFPADTPSGARIVASVREEARRTRRDWLDQLGWALERTSSLPSLVALGRNAVVALLRSSTGGATAGLAADPSFVSQLLAITEGDPLTLRVIIEDLGDGDITPEQLSRQPPGLKAYFKRALDHAAEQSSGEAVYDLLGLCATAKGPLTGDDLAALAPDTLGRATWQRDAVARVARYVIGDGSSAAGYDFGHPRLPRAVLRRANLQQRTDRVQQTVL